MSRSLNRLLMLLVVLTVPVILMAVNVRLLATETFVRWEYARPGFPAAPGFTDAERLAVAVPSTLFIVRAVDPAELAVLTDDGRPLYTAGEIEHLVDVRRAVVVLTWLALAGLAVIGLAVVLAASAGRSWRWPDLGRALMLGGGLTIGLVVAIGLGMAVAWPIIFTGFHMLFFDPGTWQFPVDSGLIRLFPNQFWYDSAVWLAGLAALEALVVIAAGFGIKRMASV
jgi:integral membrane protein (TIGR01906 family)